MGLFENAPNDAIFEINASPDDIAHAFHVGMKNYHPRFMRFFTTVEFEKGKSASDPFSRRGTTPVYDVIANLVILGDRKKIPACVRMLVWESESGHSIVELRFFHLTGAAGKGMANAAIQAIRYA